MHRSSIDGTVPVIDDNLDVQALIYTRFLNALGSQAVMILARLVPDSITSSDLVYHTPTPDEGSLHDKINVIFCTKFIFHPVKVRKFIQCRFIDHIVKEEQSNFISRYSLVVTTYHAMT